jgi:cysteinyl-tRNA synthetase
MDLRLHNTLTREKETFSPQNPQRVTMYVCGPTVYSYAHIGNARPPVAFDVLFRLLRERYGADHVVYAANITDVDDKIIAAAAEAGKPIAEITALYERIYREDMGALGVIEPTFRPHATEHVGGMIEIIETLVEKGHAYQGQNGVLFHVPSMADYGKLSGRSRDDMVAGARVEVDGGKRGPSRLRALESREARRAARGALAIARGARAGRAGISNAPPWPRPCWARRWTSTRAAST